MTVLRRELALSGAASPEESFSCRIVSARILLSVPVFIRRHCFPKPSVLAFRSVCKLLCLFTRA
jgi:hypothetical protein